MRFLIRHYEFNGGLTDVGIGQVENGKLSVELYESADGHLREAIPLVLRNQAVPLLCAAEEPTEEGMRIDDVFWTPIDSPVFLKRLEALLMHQLEVIEE